MRAASEYTFEKMLRSFLGREIEEIEFTDDEELILRLNDGTDFIIGKDEDDEMCIKKQTSQTTG